MEKVVIKSKISKKIPITVAISSFACLGMIVLGLIFYLLNVGGCRYTTAYHYGVIHYSFLENMLFPFDFVAGFLIDFGLVFGLGVCFIWCILCTTELTVTTEKIYGKSIFGKKANITLGTITSVKSCAFNGIEVITSSCNTFKFLMMRNRNDILNAINQLLRQQKNDPHKPIYDLKGARGRFLKVYDDKCIITTKAGVASLVTGNATDGEKTLYYIDIVGVQFKKAGVTIGYLQLETASSSMNNKQSNFWNENSFTFEADLNDKMDAVAEYVKKKVEENKKQKTVASVVQTPLSSADELKKYKELLDSGIITQEEFDAKKKQLLGL